MGIKYITILLFLFTCQTFVFSQDYSPLVKEGATWIMYYDDDGADYWALRIEDDTIINDLTYRKLYKYDLGSELTFPLTYPIAFQNQKSFSGLLREDSDTKKVYGILEMNTWNSFLSEECDIFMVYNYGAELEIFDFNKTVGDVFDDCHLDDNEVGTEITTDTIIDIYGEERRVLINHYGLKFIEGVGYDDGLFQSAHTWVHAGWGFGMIKYCNQNGSDCQLITNTKEITNNYNLQIYPNPTSSIFNISINGDVRRIEIFDVLGNKLDVIELGKHKYQVNDSKLNGVFYAKFHLKNNNILTQKLLFVNE